MPIRNTSMDWTTIVTSFENSCWKYRPIVVPYCWRHRSLVAREVALAGIDTADRVLNIGCGAIPATAMLLAEATGASVTAIDNSADRAHRAARCVQQSGYRDEIHVVEADGRTMPFESYTVIVVTLHTIGKNEIIENFTTAASAADRLVVRLPRSRWKTQFDVPGPVAEPTAVCRHLDPIVGTSLLIRGPSKALSEGSENRPKATANDAIS